ncbi:hypothetical protein BDW68DRAFT_183116 [Aspergillus falconensis]
MSTNASLHRQTLVPATSIIKSGARIAQEFRPARWRRASLVQNLSFLAFGSRPFLCAADAGSEFGLRVVGFVVGVLVDAFGKDEDVEEMREFPEKTGKRLRDDIEYYQGVYVEYYVEETVC